MGKFWEDEAPEILETSRNELEYYKKAGVLQVSRPRWTDEDGVSRHGKSVALIMSEPGVVDFLKSIIQE